MRQRGLRHLTSGVGLRGRLTLLVVCLVFFVLLIVATYLVRRQVADLREMSQNSSRMMRTALRLKGMTLVGNLALFWQRAAVVRDYLFLVELVESTVENDREIVYGIVMDRGRQILLHTGKMDQSTVLDGPADLFAAAATSLTVQDVSSGGIRHLEVLAPILVDNQRWGTVRLGLSLDGLNRAVAKSEKSIAAKISRSVLVTVAAAFVVLLLGSLIGMVAVRRMVIAPIDLLMDGVERIRGGELGQKVKLRAAPELNALGHAISEMSEALQQRKQALQHLNSDLLEEVGQRRRAEHELQNAHDELELRVDQRTAELVEANGELEQEVSRRTEVEQELKTFAHKLQSSNKELESFAYIASHDLQEPLRKVQAFGERLKTRYHDNLGEQGRDYLDRMINASTRMRTLISELLHYSRVTTKARPFEPVDLRKIAGDVVSDLEVAIERKQAAINIGALPVVDADSLQMRQLFQNLIGNALKFQPEGVAPVVDLTSEEVVAVPDDESGGEAREPVADSQTNGQLWCIRIKDNGIGFEQKYSERIFGLFQRLHGRNAYQGTGMGLAICRKIVERHSGRIDAESEPGQGATFVIRLPKGHHETTTVDEPKGATISG